MTPRFERFAAIDWSGAKGKRHKGIAVAMCDAGEARRSWSGPAMSGRGPRCWTGCWRRRRRRRPCSASISASRRRSPSAANICRARPDVPSTAREFWAYVDRCCDDEDLGAASFLERVHRRHFYFGIADGVKADFMHFRRCDAALNAQGGRKTASAYDAIGAAQVAKASFAGMRLLHRLDGKVPIWPMDPLPEQGSAVVEIYTRIYLRRANLPGTKLRSRAQLNRALEGARQPAGPVALRAERPPDRRPGDRGRHARAGHGRAPRLRSRRPDARNRAHRRLDVRSYVILTTSGATNLQHPQRATGPTMRIQKRTAPLRYQAKIERTRLQKQS